MNIFKSFIVSAAVAASTLGFVVLSTPAQAAGALDGAQVGAPVALALPGGETLPLE